MLIVDHYVSEKLTYIIEKSILQENGVAELFYLDSVNIESE